MQPQRASLRLAGALLSLSALASAWPAWLPDSGALIARQDSNTPAATQTSTSAPTGTGNSDKATITPAPDRNSTQAPASGNQTRTEFDPRDPAGGVAMITPGPFDRPLLYKVGDNVQWSWNYTSLQASPTAIDVLVSCSAATRTWTLTQNMTFATDVNFVWDTKDNQGSPYPVEEYTLLIHDSETAATGVAAAGYLQPFSGLKFGMYTGQPYVPLASGWSCVSCSGAASTMDRRAMGIALASSAVTVMTFTWFVTGVGLGI